MFHELSLKDSSFSKAGAKVLLFFDMTKFFGTFFSKKCFLTLFSDLLNPLFEGIAVADRAVLHFHAVVTDGVRTVTQQFGNLCGTGDTEQDQRIFFVPACEKYDL
ncbi:MAG: hypothetical protein IJQ18_00920 [Paludibacteraceae bacterium]|nr:hypothetical protein [Paludibacteraceae bacterium]